MLFNNRDLVNAITKGKEPALNYINYLIVKKTMFINNYFKLKD